MSRPSRWRGVLATASVIAGVIAAPAFGGDEAGPRTARNVEPALVPLGRVVSDGELAAQRGGQDDAQLSDMRSSARITNTSVTNASTGNNTITEGSLVNASGIPIVVQNSGNNVVIQNSTILNLQLK
jgi:hypothetical protein